MVKGQAPLKRGLGAQLREVYLLWDEGQGVAGLVSLGDYWLW